jgi:hypothetical protein
VSYRKGDQVYWTAKKVMLAQGETLLSDGSNEMRARCANRISDVAQFPVEAQDPGAEVLDAMMEDDGGAAPGLGAPALAEVDSGGIPRHTGRGMQGPALASNGGAGASPFADGMPVSSREAMERMNSMTLAQSGSSASFGSMPRYAATTTAIGSAPPVLDVSAEPATLVPEPSPSLPQPGTGLALPLDPLAASGDGGAGATPPQPGAGVLPGLLPPASGSSGGGKELANPQPGLPGETGAKPGPFIPEPNLAPPLPATDVDQAKPVDAEVPEPSSLWLAAAALAGMALLRRRRA